MAFDELRVEPHVSEIPRLLDWIEASCAGAGIVDDVKLKMMLAVEEAVANVINNAFHDVPLPYLITVRLEIGIGVVVAEVIDNGARFDPTAAPEPDLSLPVEHRRPGGLGIHLMRRMMDRIQYSRHDDRNILRLEKVRG